MKRPLLKSQNWFVILKRGIIVKLKLMFQKQNLKFINSNPTGPDFQNHNELALHGHQNNEICRDY